MGRQARRRVPPVPVCRCCSCPVDRMQRAPSCCGRWCQAREVGHLWLRGRQPAVLGVCEGMRGEGGSV